MSLEDVARWSDEFFNYVPAEQAAAEFYGDEQSPDRAELLHPMAVQFLEANPNCPYDADWLVADFIKRL